MRNKVIFGSENAGTTVGLWYFFEEWHVKIDHGLNLGRRCISRDYYCKQSN